MKNKILSIFFVIILVSVIFTNSVFAYERTYNDLTVYISDEAYEKLKTFSEYMSGDYNYFVIYWQGTYEYYFMPKDENKDIKYYRPFVSTDTVKNVCYYTVDSSFNLASYEVIDWQFNNNFEYYDTSKPHILTDVTIYETNTFEEIFFQVAPVTVLTPILEEMEMEPTMREILTLLPIMIILIVSYLALRKGLTFIKTLRKM